MRSLSSVILWVAIFAMTAVGAEEKPKPEAPKPTETFTQKGLRIERYESACCTYLLFCTATDEFVVIDPSPKISSVIAGQKNVGKKFKGIWLTHEHGDHLGGVAEVLTRWKVPSITCAAGKKEIAVVREHWKDWGFEGVDAPPIPDTLVKHGDTVNVGKLAFTTLLLPGHARGSIGFLLPGRVLFSGDVLFKGSVGRTDLHTSDQAVFERSLSDHLWDRPDGLVVFPGHGDRTTIGAEKKSNWLFQDYVRSARGLPRIERPWFGVGLDRERKEPGVRFTVITKGSPAEKCGLAVDDVLIRMGGVEILDVGDFLEQFVPRKVGEKVELVVRRGGEEKKLTIAFTARPAAK